MAETGMAVVGLLGQALSGAIQAYTFVEKTKPKKLESKYNSALLSLSVQRDRYMAWVLSIFGTTDPFNSLFTSQSITTDNMIRKRFGERSHKNITKIMLEMNKLLYEAKEAKKKYGLEGTKFKRRSRRILAWVLVGEEEFNHLVQRLREFNDDLDNLTAPAQTTPAQDYRFLYPPSWDGFTEAVADMKESAEDLDTCFVRARAAEADLNDVAEDRYNMPILLSQNRLFVKLEANRFHLPHQDIHDASQWLGIQLKERPSSIKFPIVITAKDTVLPFPVYEAAPPTSSRPTFSDHTRNPYSTEGYPHIRGQNPSDILGHDQIQRHIRIVFESVRRSGSESFQHDHLNNVALGLKRLNRKHIASDSPHFMLASQHIRSLGYCLGGFCSDNRQFNHFAYQCSPTIGSPTGLSIHTLEDILASNTYQIDRSEKVRLSFLLATSVLHLHGTSWISVNFNAKDIYYLHGDSPVHRSNAFGAPRLFSEPYLEIKDPDMNQTGIEPGDTATFFFHLGLLLLRILAPDRYPTPTIQWLKTERARKVASGEGLVGWLQSHQQWEWKKIRYEYGSQVEEAVYACLLGQMREEMEGSQEKPTSRSQNQWTTDMRRVFYERVVSKLWMRYFQLGH